MMVRLPHEVVDAALATAPQSFTLHARNPARDMQVGGDVINFGPSLARRTSTTPSAAAAMAISTLSAT